MKNTILSIALVLASSVALADGFAPSTVGVHIGSKHSSYKQDWEDFNPGVYARWDNGITVGTLRNSERGQSFYAGWTGAWALSQRIEAAITLGGITGYKRAPVMPLVVPSVRLAVTKNLGLRTSLIINPDVEGAHALHLSAEWSF